MKLSVIYSFLQYKRYSLLLRFIIYYKKMVSKSQLSILLFAESFQRDRRYDREIEAKRLIIDFFQATSK